METERRTVANVKHLHLHCRSPARDNTRILKLKIDFMRLQTLRSPSFPSLVLSKSLQDRRTTLGTPSHRRSESHTCLKIDPSHPRSMKMSGPSFFYAEHPTVFGKAVGDQLTGRYMEFPLALVLCLERTALQAPPSGPS